MSSSRKRLRGAHATSIDDDSIPTLDGGWVKEVQYSQPKKVVALSAAGGEGNNVDDTNKRLDAIDNGLDISPDDSQMESAIKQLVATLRQTYEDDKKRFRNALQIAFRQRLSQIEEKATEQLRRKLHKARKKDKALLAEKDARLNDLLAQLSTLAAEVDRQRALVHKASEAFEGKIMESDLVNNELHDLGRELSKQAERLGNAMVDERSKPMALDDD